MIADLKSAAKHNPDTVIITDSHNIGFKDMKFKKGTNLVFINCEAPSFTKNKINVIELSLDPRLCVDTVTFPNVEPLPYSCDILVALDKPINIQEEINSLRTKYKVWIVGQPINHPNYIGHLENPDLLGLAKSAKYCYSQNYILKKVFNFYNIPSLTELSIPLNTEPQIDLSSFEDEWRFISEQISALHTQ